MRQSWCKLSWRKGRKRCKRRNQRNQRRQRKRRKLRKRRKRRGQPRYALRRRPHATYSHLQPKLFVNLLYALVAIFRFRPRCLVLFKHENSLLSEIITLRYTPSRELQDKPFSSLITESSFHRNVKIMSTMFNSRNPVHVDTTFDKSMKEAGDGETANESVDKRSVSVRKDSACLRLKLPSPRIALSCQNVKSFALVLKHFACW